MTGPTTLGMGNALQRMGVQGGQLPKIPLTTWQPVLVMGQMQSLTSDPFEARAVYSGSNPNSGTKRNWELHSRAPGGTVIEHLVLTSSGTSQPWHFFITTTPLVFGQVGALDADKLDVGGVASKGEAKWNSEAVVPAGGLPVLKALASLSLGAYRMFIPAGSFFSIWNGNDGIDVGLLMVTREISEAHG